MPSRVSESLVFSFLIAVSFSFISTNAWAESTTAAGPTATKPRQQLLDERKEAVKNLREQKKATIEAKRNEIKDAKKKALVGRIDAKLTNINKNRSNHFLKVLARLEEILKKIEGRAAELKATGIEVTAVTSAVTAARSAITTAKAAVEAQASKSYVVTAGSEATLRADVGKVASGLEADLKAVNALVKSARDAVEKAAKTLKNLKISTKVTPSPSPVPVE